MDVSIVNNMIGQFYQNFFAVFFSLVAPVALCAIIVGTTLNLAKRALRKIWDFFTGNF